MICISIDYCVYTVLLTCVRCNDFLNMFPKLRR